MSKCITPEFHADSFNCPTCGAYSHMQWSRLRQNSMYIDYHTATCACCINVSLWVDNRELGQRMLLPDNGNAPMPVHDMPENVKIDYLEAASIYTRSPRGAAALLRLSLQKLFIHLGENGKNINNDIRSLAKKGILSQDVIRVADTVRIVGNNAVHPGEMSENDIDYVSAKLFNLINFIINKAITEPRELEELYAMTPESPRIAAEQADSRT
tara:strand:+ start:1151 stop:1786 length:636 start_codon:yes stop_codon:yes gene_type:complete